MESTDEQEAINRSMYLSAIQLLSAGGSVPSSSLIDAVGSQRIIKAKVSGGKIEVDNDISNYLDVDLMTDEEMPGNNIFILIIIKINHVYQLPTKVSFEDDKGV